MDLLRALESGRLRRAAIDVFDTEPLPPSDKIRNASGLIATPHVGDVTRETYAAFFDGFVKAIQAFAGGHPVRILHPA